MLTLCETLVRYELIEQRAQSKIPKSSTYSKSVNATYNLMAGREILATAKKLLMFGPGRLFSHGPLSPGWLDMF